MGTPVTAIRTREDGSLITRSRRNASQNPYEFSSFVELLVSERVSSYLEIGARHGDTFFDVVRSMPAGSLAVAVDLPGGAWGTTKSRASLEECCRELQELGYNATCRFGDSQSAGIHGIVCRHGQFDAVLIDGDHRYEGVLRDWELYGDRGRLIAFHDIAGYGQIQRSSKLEVEVPRLWAEIKNDFRHVEFIAEGSRMGIGVLWTK